MNREEWLHKFFMFDIWLNSMLSTIPNFNRINRKDEFVIKKSRKYYAQINTVSLKVLENREMPHMMLSTYDMERKIVRARELLIEQLEKRKIPNPWDSLLPRL